MEKQPHSACEQTKSKKKNETKSRHIQIDRSFYCSV